MYLKHLTAAAFIITLCTSCHTYTGCTNQSNYMLMFYRDTTVGVRDTACTMISFVANGSFNTPVDTYTHVAISGMLPEAVWFSESTNMRCDTSDWIAILYPSHNQYRIKNIRHHGRTLRDLNVSSCANDLSYVVNDSAYLLHGDGATAYMSVKY